MESKFLDIIKEYGTEHQINLLVWVALILVLAWGLPFAARKIAEVVSIFVEIKAKLDSIGKPKVDSTKLELKSVTVANSKLEKITIDRNADRALMYLCHNGIHSRNRIDFHKFSVIAEGNSGRFGTIMDQVQSVPSLMYGHWVDIWVEDGVIAIDDISQIKKSLPGVHALLDSHSVKSLCVIPVWPSDKKGKANRTVDDMPDGFGLIEYCRDSHQFTANEIAELRFDFQAIYEGMESASRAKYR